MRLLGRRDHSRLELRRKLSRRGHDDEVVRAVLDRFRDAGYLDDAKFARSVVRRRASGRGPRAIAAELAALGIDRAAAAAALAEFGPEEQLRSAIHLAERLYARLASDRQLGYRDLLDHVGPKLLRRGFPETIVRQACRTVLEGLGQAPPPTV
ncbi:MAG TPA: regulatory protein RecX [Candidatus Dormibacteraeota bacterium]